MCGILDCFAGTGMSGVAAQLAKRRCVLIELSPLASSIASSLNSSVGIDSLANRASALLMKKLAITLGISSEPTWGRWSTQLPTVFGARAWSLSLLR